MKQTFSNKLLVPLVLAYGLVTPVRAELQGRLETPPGSGVYEAYYDTELEITWTTNMNLSGQCWWFDDANAWAAGLMFHGTVGWRLPNVDVLGGGVSVTYLCPSAEACLDNEFAYHRYINGISPSNPGPFLWPPIYATFWSMNAHGSLTGWDFDFANGHTSPNYRDNCFYAWAVHDGDVFVDDPDGDGIYPSGDNCPEVYNPDQADADSDGGGDLCDCAPEDGSVIAAPGEVTGVTLSGASTTTITWDDQAGEAGTATVYDVVSGQLSDLRAEGGFDSAICYAADLPAPGETDESSLPVGGGFYYLVCSHNPCGVSTHGAGREALDMLPPCP
jgi:hypothetical protein